MAAPKVNLIIAMPTMGKVDLHLATFMYGAVSRSMSYLAIRECLWLNKSFLKVDESRNFLAEEILKRCEGDKKDWETWVLWTDDDMAPPDDAINKLFVQMLVKPEIDLLAAWMSRKIDSDPGLVFSPDGNHAMLPGKDFKIGDCVEVGWVPTGFLMHRASLLQKLPRPFFKCDSDTEAGEDRWFSQQCKKIGAKMYVHTGCPVGHADAAKKKVYWPYGGATTFVEGLPVIETPPPPEDTEVAEQTQTVEPVPTEAVAAMASGYEPVRNNGHVLKAGIQTNITDQGKDYVCAFINCDDPELYSSMVTQLGGSPFVAVLDNGAHLGKFAEALASDPEPHPFKIVSTPENVGWGGGFNALMTHVVENMPHVKAVWICNDDITGASAEMAQSLYDTMQSLGAAVVSPSLSPESICSNDIMYNKPATNGGLRRVQFVDFVAPMISVDAWKQVGPLDVETFGWGHGLDIDWTQRVKKNAGFPLYIDDSLQITHAHPGTTTDKQGTAVEHMRMGWQRKIIERYGNSWDKLAEV